MPTEKPTQPNAPVEDGPWPRGIDSLKDPTMVEKGYYRWGVNVTNRGGMIRTRPGFAVIPVLVNQTQEDLLDGIGEGIGPPGSGSGGGGGGGGNGGGVIPPNYTSDDFETTALGERTTLTNYTSSGDTTFAPASFALEPGNYTTDDFETTLLGSVISLTNYFSFGDTSFSPGFVTAPSPGNYAFDDFQSYTPGTITSLVGGGAVGGDTTFGTGYFVSF